jgi:hypothetical protein
MHEPDRVVIITTMSEPPPMPATWPEQRAYVGKINHLGAGNLIKEILADDAATLFHFTVARIMEKLQEENRVLAFNDASTIPQVAWAGRNLMELRILVRFVCRSRANLERFSNDILTTGPRTMDALLRVSNNLAKMVPNPLKASPDQYREVAGMEQARFEAGLGKDSPLMAGACASKVGLQKEYLLFSRITSPLIHPTAISVLKTFDLESHRDSLTSLGLKLATDVILDAREHIEKYGFKPKN